jgi:outer membrane protein OmpA-like peptidoglycan-associated protein
MQVQGRTKRFWTVCPSVVFIISLSGCATQQWVREQLAALDQRVTTTEQRIGEVDAKATEALTRFNNLRLERQFVLELKSGSEFNSGSSRLSKEAEQAVSGFLSDLDNTEGLVFLVAGHTDAVGSDEKNFELGQKRATRVAQHLIKQGIDPFRVTAVSYGENNPVADNQTQEGKRQNRRIEIRVYREGITATPPEPNPQANIQNSTY